ncbi:MAG: IS1096 element passenger TnpR family protein, partial [Bacteroidota bacterium]
MVYRFKIWFEDMDDVVRWIEIKPSHTFMDFNNIIQEAIGFDNKELASFFVSDDRWRKISEVKKAKPIGDADLTGNTNAPLMQ